MKRNESPQADISRADKTWHKKISTKTEKSFDTQLAILEEFFQAIGDMALNPKILKSENHEGDVQLRCAYKDLPIKIYCLTHYEYSIELYAKTNILPRLQQIAGQWPDDPLSPWFFVTNPVDLINTWAAEYSGATTIMNILWNPEKIPRKADASDPWSQVDANRVFLSRGIFIEGRDQEIEKNMFLYQSMPEGLRGAITDTLSRNKISSLRIHCSGKVSGLIDQRCLMESPRPLSMVFDVLNLFVRIARELETPETLITTGIAGGEDNAANVTSNNENKIVIATCSYCASKYLLSDKFSCPNCGAAHG